MFTVLDSEYSATDGNIIDPRSIIDSVDGILLYVELYTPNHTYIYYKQYRGFFG